MSDKYLTYDGGIELVKQTRAHALIFNEAVYARATIIAQKEGRVYVDEVDIKKACKNITIVESNRI